MNSLILGSGFGLYGYLPAISSYCRYIYLDKRYKGKFLERSELKKLSYKIKWYDKISKIIDDINIVIIAKNPKDQLNNIKSLNLKKKIKHLFLEKPISNNPKNSLLLIKYLELRKIKYSFGFLFEYLSWFKFLKKKKSKNNKIKILWHIKKNNKNNKWKYNPTLGGGALRFYGVHLIKILFELKFLNLKSNIVNNQFWSSQFYDDKSNIFEVELKITNKDKFKLTYNNKILVNSINPFKEKINLKQIDPRASILKKYIKRHLFNRFVKYKRYDKLIHFWDKIEKNQI